MRRGLFIVALLAALSLGASNPPPKQGQQPKAEQAQPTAPPTPEYSPYSNWRDEACYKAKNHDSADLCAQWRAAVAAEKAVKETRRATTWAIVATVLSALAFAALVWTLIQTERALSEARIGNRLSMRQNVRSTRRAIESAKDTAAALDAADRTANAAARQVEISREIANKQLRAYLDFDGVWWARFPAKDKLGFVQAGITCRIKNYGHTPAGNTTLEVSWCTIDSNGERSAQQPNPPRIVKIASVAPTDHFDYTAQFPVPEDIWNALSANAITHITRYKAKFTDVFGESHVLISEFRSDGTELGEHHSCVEGSRQAD